MNILLVLVIDFCEKMTDQIVFRGELVGHGGWVTSIATSSADPNTILTSSRDKVRPFPRPSLISKIQFRSYRQMPSNLKSTDRHRVDLDPRGG